MEHVVEERELKFNEYWKYFFEGSLFFIILGFLTALSEPAIKGINKIMQVELDDKYSSSIFIDHMPTTTMSSLILVIALMISISAVIPNRSWNAWGSDKALDIIKRLVDYAKVSVNIMLGMAIFLPFYSFFTNNDFYWKLSLLLVIVSLQFYYVPFTLHQLAHSSKNTVKYWKRVSMVALAVIVCAIVLSMQAKMG
jgi:hypothetical protein